MFNWQKMCANTAGYSGLHEELRNCRGRYILEGVKMPESCGSQICTIEFCYHGEDYIQMRCLDSPVAYNGGNPRIAQWLENGSLEFGSFEQLTAFLRQFNEEPGNPSHANGTGSGNESPNTSLGQEMSPHITMPSTSRNDLDLTRSNNRNIVIDMNWLVSDISETVRGQEEAVKCVAHYACAAVAKVAPQCPPSIVLAGATGQGKTLMGKTLAEALNHQINDPNRKYGTIVVQCNELTEDFDVSRLVGGSPNYVGYGDDNLLTPVLSNPYQVIIFDEIEKAAPRVLDVLMGVLDCGELMMTKPVDGKNMLNLKHSIILFTTNLSINQEVSQNQIGFGSTKTESQGNADMSTRYRNALVAHGMRREIVARFSDIVHFHELKGAPVVDIILLEIQRCASEYGFSISFVSHEIIQGLYDDLQISGFGARMIKRKVSNHFMLLFGSSIAVGTNKTFELIGNYDSPFLRPSALEGCSSSNE